MPIIPGRQLTLECLLKNSCTGGGRSTFHVEQQCRIREFLVSIRGHYGGRYQLSRSITCRSAAGVNNGQSHRHLPQCPVRAVIYGNLKGIAIELCWPVKLGYLAVGQASSGEWITQQSSGRRIKRKIACNVRGGYLKAVIGAVDGIFERIPGFILLRRFHQLGEIIVINLRPRLRIFVLTHGPRQVPERDLRVVRLRP